MVQRHVDTEELMAEYFPIVWSREAEACWSLETLTKESGTLHSDQGASATHNDGSTPFGPEIAKEAGC